MVDNRVRRRPISVDQIDFAIKNARRTVFRGSFTSENVLHATYNVFASALRHFPVVGAVVRVVYANFA